MLIFAEVLRVAAVVLLIFSSAFYLRHLEKTKKLRKLSGLELTMYITMQTAYALFAASVLISVFVH